MYDLMVNVTPGDVILADHINTVSQLAGARGSGFDMVDATGVHQAPPPVVGASKMCRASLAADLTSGMSTVNVDSVKPFTGTTKPTENDAETLEVYNVFGFAAPNDSKCIIVEGELDSGDTGWILLFPLVAQTVRTNFQVDTDNQKLQSKTRPVYVMPTDDETDWTDDHEGTTCS